VTETTVEEGRSVQARGGQVTGWDNIGAALSAFDGPEWRIKDITDHGRRADIVVTVVGLQYAEGHAALEIIIDCPDTPIITPAEARKLANALIAAADSAEGAVRATQLLSFGDMRDTGARSAQSASD
jgi:hypothetical protein